MNNSIRVKNKNIYEIEVNDKGEKISFDLTDVSLPIKLIECFEDIKKITNEFNEKEKEIMSREDVTKEDSLTSENIKDLLYLRKDYFENARGVLDKFIGQDGCQKIFGDRNNSEMFDDLFVELEPHFVKMGMNLDKAQKKLVEKYSHKNKKVLR